MVAGSTAAVCAPRGAIGKAFQLKYAVKEYFFEDIRTKEQKSFSAIEICASLVKLRDKELSGYVPR